MSRIVNNLLKGIIFIAIVHIMKDVIPLSLPLNVLTVITAALLGIPGLLAVTLLSTLIN